MEAFLEQRIQYLERLISSKTRSPIVVQLASLYLEAGRPHDALRYCDNAIAHFPYYTTAHLLRGKVLYALEMKAEARREFEFVHSILPDATTVKALLEQIPPPDSEAFEELAQAGAGSPSRVETSPVTLAPPPEAPKETDHSLKEEELLDSYTVSAIGSEPGAEGRTEEQGERSGAAEEISRDVRAQDSFGLPTSEESDASTAESGSQQEHAVSEPIDEASSGATTFGELDQVETGSGEPVSAEAAGEAGQSYEAFAETMRGELSGSENTLSLEEFLAREKPLPSEPKTPDDIGELAEKLKAAPKITPIIDLTEKKAPPPSEEDTPASTGFVTPTLAEIYAKQGWYDDAIVAFKTLARIKPAERERFEKRIRELELLKKSEGGGV